MKKNASVVRVGEFTDFNGVKRKYVIAAVSEVLEESALVVTNEEIEDFADDLVDFIYADVREKDPYIEGTPVVKKLSIGYSICNVGDEFNEELGKTIAIGKAEKRPDSVTYTTKKGVINTTMVEALVAQEMAFFEANPGSVIAGYDRAKAKALGK